MARPTNVTDAARAATVFLGGLLVLRGLARPSVWSLPRVVLGGVLAVRAVRGRSLLYWAVRPRTTAESCQRAGPSTSPHALVVEKSVCIDRPRAEVYRFWRALENMPRFMSRVQAVEIGPDDTSHWIVKGPGGATLEWRARMTANAPGELLAWSTVEGSDVRHEGKVQFSTLPGTSGTMVHVWLRYEPVGGKLGALAARLFGEEPAQHVEGDLRRLKQILEAGEVATGARRRA